MSVLDALLRVCADPRRYIFRRWNWKAAVLSGGLRGGLFFVTNLTAGLTAAEHAATVDLLFRVPLVGVYAALVQALAVARPAWAATATVMVLIPAIAHSIEYVVHRSAGTPALHTSMAASVALSALSSGFESFAMRRGAMVVGPDARSVRGDLLRLPALVGAFAVAAPCGAYRWYAGRARRRRQA
jgi:hypothetical protein